MMGASQAPRAGEGPWLRRVALPEEWARCQLPRRHRSVRKGAGARTGGSLTLSRGPKLSRQAHFLFLFWIN